MMFEFHHGIYFLHAASRSDPNEKRKVIKRRQTQCPKKRFALMSEISDKVLNYVPTFGVGRSTSRFTSRSDRIA